MVQFHRDLLNNMDIMQREMSRLLDHFACSKVPMVRFSRAVWEPAIDMYETEDEIVITAELAGVRESDIEIVVNRRIVTIYGIRKKAVPGGKRGTYHQMEISSGSFERYITLPVAVDTVEARATYENGLMEVILPKARNDTNLKIKVKTSKL